VIFTIDLAPSIEVGGRPAGTDCLVLASADQSRRQAGDGPGQTDP
jgi:hypothetical protein